MLRQNMGRLDRTVRLIAGVALMPVGLFALGGWQGNLGGILVAVLSLMPILTSLIGFCPAYVPFGVSTNAGEGVREEPPDTGKGDPLEGMKAEMASQCVKEMPHMMAVCCGAGESEEETVKATSGKV